jgi:hypothetical protein
VIRRSLGESDHQRFHEYAAAQDRVKELQDWYAARCDLSDEEIAATWKADRDGEPQKTHAESYARMLAKMRILR